VFALLERSDLGFVHQVLTYCRDHDASVTSTNRVINTVLPSHASILARRGRSFLTADEQRRRLNRRAGGYGWFLAKATVRLRPWRVPRFAEFHREALDDLIDGYSATDARLGRGLLLTYRAALVGTCPGARR
jgi:hypothetical protein